MLVIIILIILIIIFIFSQYNEKEKYLTYINGFWQASDEFKEKSNIDHMMIYFSHDIGNKYNGYFILIVDGKELSNNTITVDITNDIFNKNRLNIKFLNGTENIDMLPDILEMELNIFEGSIILKDQTNKIYAILFKENELSNKIIIENNTNHKKNNLNDINIDDSEDI